MRERKLTKELEECLEDAAQLAQRLSSRLADTVDECGPSSEVSICLESTCRRVERIVRRLRLVAFVLLMQDAREESRTHARPAAR